MTPICHIVQSADRFMDFWAGSNDLRLQFFWFDIWLREGYETWRQFIIWLMEIISNSIEAVPKQNSGPHNTVHRRYVSYSLHNACIFLFILFFNGFLRLYSRITSLNSFLVLLLVLYIVGKAIGPITLLK